MKKGRKTKSIRAVLIRDYGILLTVLLLIFTTAYTAMHTVSEVRALGYYGTNLLQQTDDRLSSELKVYEAALKILQNNNMVQEFALSGGRDGATWSSSDKKKFHVVRGMSDLYDQIRQVTSVTGDAASTGIYLVSGDAICLFHSLPEDQIGEEYCRIIRSCYEKMQAEKLSRYMTGPVHFAGEDHIVIFQSLIDNQNMDCLGALFLNVPVSSLDRLLRGSQMSGDKAAFLLNGDSGLIAASDRALFEAMEAGAKEKNLLGETLYTIAGTDYVRVEVHSEYSSWDMIGLMAMDDLYLELRGSCLMMFLIFALSLTGVLLLTLFLTRYFTAPIEHLNQTMKDVSKSRRLDISYEDHQFKETEELGESFVGMLTDIDELIVKNQESMLREREAQLSALQSQINPHFLFNTLNTINYMLVLEDKPEIGELVINLGDLLRASLGGINQFIRLSEEISLVEKYLAIQQARFSEELTYSVTVSQDALECRVICLLLQPIVENAILHGFEKTNGCGYIEIWGDLEEGGQKLILTVEDNGQGMSIEQCENLLKEKPAVPGKRRHIGIVNVHRRIQLMYGEAYGITIKSELGKGTCIQLSLPAVREE